MTTQDTLRWADWIGHDVYDPDGDKIGSIDEVYVDEETGQPSWIAVRTGLFGMKQSFVPVEGASFAGDHVTVPFDKATVKDAPRIDPEGRLSRDEERELYAYYGMTYQPWTGPAHTRSEEPLVEDRLRLRRWTSERTY
jgi:sporulation protein YlmC with PRC-barrel domain